MHIDIAWGVARELQRVQECGNDDSKVERRHRWSFKRRAILFTWWRWGSVSECGRLCCSGGRRPESVLVSISFCNIRTRESRRMRKNFKASTLKLVV